MTILLLLGLLFSEDAGKKAIEAHLHFLADDLLEGRETTYPGQKIAARYIASQFESFGLQGLYPNENAYYHTFNLYKGHIDEHKTLVRIGNATLYLEKGFTFYGYHPKQGSMEGEVVFIGYGYKSKKYNYNSMTELEGKIVVVVDGYPAFLEENFKDSPKRREHLRNKQVKWATKAGALALIFIHGPDLGLKDLAPEPAKGGFFSKSKLSTEPVKVNGGDFPILELKANQMQQLFGEKASLVKAHMQQQSQSETPASLVLEGIKAEIETELGSLALSTENVVGRIEGTDPKLKDEYVVISAHYDHLGKKGDDIYNGADDNASGTALLIEMAQRMAKKPTRRSILFLALTAEEKGLIGSRQFLNNCPVPVTSIVANINMDMVGRNDIKVMGLIPGQNDDITTMNEWATEINAQLEDPFEFDISFDRYNSRSDHYNFIRKGIPAIFFFAGDHDDYHKPTDTWDKINYDKIVKAGVLVEKLLSKVGNNQERPQFLKPKEEVSESSEPETEDKAESHNH